jgi:hydroxymethylglutaryl-CoA lyase
MMVQTDAVRAVGIREVGLRDGLQIEEPISTEAKFRLLDALLATGVRRIETTAFVSPAAVPAMSDAEKVSERVRDMQLRHPDVTFSALVANMRGTERALASGMNNLEYVVSAGEGHSQANARCGTDQAVDAITSIAAAVHSEGGICEVIIATAWDCPFDGPVLIDRTTEICARAVAGGADQLCLGDTIGTTVPGRVVDLVESVRAAAPGVPVGAHFHNTRGAGLASAWAAVSAGVTMLDASIGGLGGCPFAPGASGNIATEELVYLLENSGIATDVNLESALKAAALVEELVGHETGSQLLRAGGPSRPRRSWSRTADASGLGARDAQMNHGQK